ncbi:hypothetical protein KR100_12130 [Synechococcus sp. KORDI-100]|uniref:type IV pilin protein n=1 Tax=Synechococcus sp. KORDI-100 TaxID=1280380 RepID=UPI0004E0A9AB|nr:prepilin-type N-terminal cleavage/methylation domain-containing protein [Synechococcus sp. KORDI-100]AII44098.1 hypothetical protein KR100_12130 [Synechococcus sp. KORDI-100]
MTSLNSKLQLALINRKKRRNLLEKGFTLVELMIVIVIVGILSAVALPNFLNQTKKARLTEAKTIISAGLKQANMLYLEGNAVAAGSTTACDDIEVPAAPQNDWAYTCTPTATDMTISAAGVADSTNDGVGSGDWVMTYSTGVVTEGTPTGL